MVMEKPPTSPEEKPLVTAASAAVAASSSSSPPPAGATSSTTKREAAVMQSSAEKTCYASMSSLFTTPGPQGWAELPYGLLQTVIADLSSFRDLLAFGASCCLWRNVVPRHLPTSPPLLLYPNVRIHFPRRFPPRVRHKLFSKCTWKLIDPVHPSASSQSLLPLSTLNNMTFVGCSYGHAIFSYNEQCLLVNVLTGAMVVPPCVPLHFPNHVSYGTLTAPITSPDSHLLVGDGHSLFQWHVGSNSWLEHPLNNGLSILQTVVFKGQIFALGLFQMLFSIHLAPRFTTQVLAFAWGEGFEDNQGFFAPAWLVVCGDMLLLIKLVQAAGGSDSKTFQFNAFWLELSDSDTEPARWVKVDKLEGWAIFISTDARCPALCCMNPERWGGRSNCIYFPCQSVPWTAVQLGDRFASSVDVDVGYHYSKLEPTWVLPATFPRSGQ